MYVGTLPPVSNRATWVFECEVVDDETGDLVDLSAITVSVEVRDPLTCMSVLTATNNSGITTQTGMFVATFSRDDMAKLCARTYEVGVTLADSSDTAQFIIGKLPVLDGIVSK